MRQVSTAILSAASSASQIGAALDTRQTVSMTFQVYGTNADESGTLKIQGSNDNILTAGGVGTPVNWSDITNASVSVASGAAAFIVNANMSFAYVRAVYTRTSGGAANKLIVCQANGLSI